MATKREAPDLAPSNGEAVAFTSGDAAASKTASPAVDATLLQRLFGLLEPVRRVVDPMFVGLERIPEERPLLFVGNHTLYGLLDVPFLMRQLYVERGIVLRSLGDHIHFRIPGWAELARRGGAVDGTRENCSALMRAGEAILVYPGGAREVAKRRGERYALVWKERLGFIRMAVAHGCTIVPFASVGIDDAFDVVFDADDVLASRLGPIIRSLGIREDALFPISRGLGPTPLPRPERLYFHFAAPIATAEWRGRESDDALCWALRDRVGAAILQGVAEMQAVRAKDPRRAFWPRLRDAALGRRGG